MKVLIVGGGGREHALAWRLRHEDPSLELLAAPGNPGIAELARCVAVSATDLDGLLALARQESVALTVVGPEAPLAAGLVDRFRDARLPVFGPTRDAAEIETSKAFSKRLMRHAHVPTARAVTTSDPVEAKAAAARYGAADGGGRVVVKASGLAAGKGVVVCPSVADAERAIDEALLGRVFGDAGATVLVEEFMEGEELSLFAVTDGTRVVPLVPAQDHKRLLAGDRGPNTGGMGAYAPVSLAGGPGLVSPTSGIVGTAVDRILLPTLAAMRQEGRPFTGLLYAGLMLTGDGPQVVEFNCRFGDPETQAVLPILDAATSLLELMLAVARREPLAERTVRATGYAVTTVLAAAGYPEQPLSGDPIVIPPAEEGVLVFHAGTRRADDGTLLTAGGRVLAVTGLGTSLSQARERGTAFAGRIDFPGKQYRADIGWREFGRLAHPG